MTLYWATSSAKLIKLLMKGHFQNTLTPFIRQELAKYTILEWYLTVVALNITCMYTRNIGQGSLCTCGAIETTSHYMLSCDHNRMQRIRYLYLITQPMSVPKLLSWIPEATKDKNNFIFKQLQLYIWLQKELQLLLIYNVERLVTYRLHVNVVYACVYVIW